jgi:hypothetical protein
MVRKDRDQRRKGLRSLEPENPFHLERYFRLVPKLPRNFGVSARHGRVEPELQLFDGQFRPRRHDSRRPVNCQRHQKRRRHPNVADADKHGSDHGRAGQGLRRVLQRQLPPRTDGQQSDSAVPCFNFPAAH